MWFKALPVATIGGAAAAIGGTLLAISGMPRSLAEYLVGGGFLLSSGAGMLVLAGAVVHQRRRATALAREREDNALVQLAERVRAAIVKANPENTLERISEQVGAAPRLTALALARLRKRGQLQEDLNTTSGDWYYVAVSPDAKLTGKNLDDALRELEGRNDR